MSDRGGSWRPPRAIAEVLTARTIEDLTLKMHAVKKLPQEEMIRLFFDMCDWDIDLIIQEGRKRCPGKSDAEIMRDHHWLKQQAR